MKIATTILAASLAMTLVACGGSDEVAEETTAGTVEVPADEAMTGVEAPVIVDTAPAVADVNTPAEEASQPVADAEDPTQTTADEAERVAEEAALAAEAATAPEAGEF